MDQKESNNRRGDGVRPWIKIVFGCGLLLAAAGTIAYFMRPLHQGPSPEETLDSVQRSDPLDSNRPSSIEAARIPATSTNLIQGTAQSGTFPPSATDVRGGVPIRPAPSAESRQLVGALVQINMTNGPLTPEKLALWQQQLQRLTNHGAAVIPAIREFLETKQDARFESIGGSAAVGQPSLRVALFDAMLKIGGTEALQVLGESLGSTNDPREIGFLAHNLEQQAPGSYAQVAVDSARRALSQAISGELGQTDVAALFYVLREHGGIGALPDLLETKRRWPYYSAIALEGLSDGAGVPALIELARDTATAARVNRSAALQVLAQMAPESPAAHEALLEQARTSTIQTAIWMKMSALLGGERLRMGPGPDIGLPPVQEPVITSAHLAGGNQNVCTTSILDSLTPEQIKNRVQLIDELLSAKPDGAAIPELQRARTTLSTRLQSKGP